MKAFYRIRRYLILLLFTLYTAHSTLDIPDFDKCETEGWICAVHKTCKTPGSTTNKYIKPDDLDDTKIINNNKCSRYLIIRASDIEKVEIEFRDDKIEKTSGAVLWSGTNAIFECIVNEPSGTLFGISSQSSESASDKTYCKFTATAKNDPKNIAKVLKENAFATIKYGSSTIDIDPLPYDKILACDWNSQFFRNKISNEDPPEEEPGSLSIVKNGRRCEYFNWYSSDGKLWDLIGDFGCHEGKVTTTKVADTKTPIYPTDSEFTKCSRLKCATCQQPKGSGGNYTASDGKSCATITCEKYMQLETGSGPHIHPNKTLTCATDSAENEPKWDGGYLELKNVTCVDDVRCVKLQPIDSNCPPDPKSIPEGKNCTKANLDSSEISVCGQDEEIWLEQRGTTPRQMNSFNCSLRATSAQGAMNVEKGSNVYCLKTLEKQPIVRSAPQAASAGKLIGIICGVAVVLIVIIIVIVLCARRFLKKKGNRDEMKSVSVTGRGDKKNKSKKKKDKKGLKSSSKMSSEISAPPPPPCPDSVPGLKVEQDLPGSAPGSAPPSSDGVVPPAVPAAPAAPAAGAPVVGPDTGKPDKPAELIDIKLLSEKKDDKDSKKEDKKSSKENQDATIVNTVTGTQSGAEPVKNDNTADTTKKTGKNESARSDTGKHTKTQTTKKDKDVKKQVDKHGRGLTDDDDYNIDEGAKPVNHVDKNKKPYAPAVDPRKKMINVTMTEDEDGHLKPRGKDSPFSP